LIWGLFLDLGSIDGADLVKLWLLFLVILEAIEWFQCKGFLTLNGFLAA
jgi:hypothetical protein